MSVPRKQDDDEPRRFYWRLRTGLEVIKAMIWAVLQWIRSGGSSWTWLP
ncbi:hypothetical protein [Actinomadura sp. 3N508]